MATNPNLVLKPVTDKNGVTSSRWVKPVQGNAGANAIPPVSMGASVLDKKGLRISTLGSLYGILGQHVDEDMYSIDDLTSTIKQADDETLAALLKYLTVDGDESNYDRVEQVAEWLLQYDDRDETYLRELLTYRDVFDEYVDVHFVEAVITRLHKCADLPPMDDYSGADDATKERVTQVLRNTENRFAASYDSGMGERLVLGERMRKVMKDNADQLDDILAIMEERDTEDPELVLSILNANTPALSNGIL